LKIAGHFQGIVRCPAVFKQTHYRRSRRGLHCTASAIVNCDKLTVFIVKNVHDYGTKITTAFTFIGCSSNSVSK